MLLSVTSYNNITPRIVRIHGLGCQNCLSWTPWVGLGDMYLIGSGYSYIRSSLRSMHLENAWKACKEVVLCFLSSQRALTFLSPRCKGDRGKCPPVTLGGPRATGHLEFSVSLACPPSLSSALLRASWMTWSIKQLVYHSSTHTSTDGSLGYCSRLRRGPYSAWKRTWGSTGQRILGSQSLRAHLVQKGICEHWIISLMVSQTPCSSGESKGWRKDLQEPAQGPEQRLPSHGWKSEQESNMGL